MCPSTSPGRHRLQFCLHSWTWNLCGIELPESLLVAMAQESGQTRKVGLTIAALMADSGARRLRACGGGSELDDQRTPVQRPRRSVDNNLSCKFCIASC